MPFLQNTNHKNGKDQKKVRLPGEPALENRKVPATLFTPVQQDRLQQRRAPVLRRDPPAHQTRTTLTKGPTP
jgi:hypothetical protein